MAESNQNTAEGSSSNVIVREKFPPGYRFVPTDEELLYYLRIKLLNKSLPVNAFEDVQLYQYHPRDLCRNRRMYGSKEWYFFTRRDRKYPRGNRPARKAGNGFWKATAADAIVKSSSNGQEIGRKKVLVYFEDKENNRISGKKTDWIMHEYRTDQHAAGDAATTTATTSEQPANNTMLDKWVVCRVYHRKTRSRRDEQDQDDDAQEDADQIQVQYYTNNTNANLITPHQTHQNLQPYNYHQSTFSQATDVYIRNMDQKFEAIPDRIPNPCPVLHLTSTFQLLRHEQGNISMQSSINDQNSWLPQMHGNNAATEMPVECKDNINVDQFMIDMNNNIIAGGSEIAASANHLDFSTEIPKIESIFNSLPPLDPNMLNSSLGDSLLAGQLESQTGFNNFDFDGTNFNMPFPPIPFVDEEYVTSNFATSRSPDGTNCWEWNIPAPPEIARMSDHFLTPSGNGSASNYIGSAIPQKKDR